jgi:AcrR family transcriptional regulator
MNSRPSRQRSSGHRRRQILDAALSCFLDQGFDATTIEQIRAASGASHGSIYHHFGSKEAIALALYVEGIQEYQTNVLTALRRQTTARAGIRALIAAHLAWVEANPERSLYVTRVDMSDASGPTAQRIAEVNQDFFRAVHEWLLPFVEKGEVIRVPSALYVPLVLGPTAHFARHWLAHRMALDFGEVADVFAGAAWKALKAE